MKTLAIAVLLFLSGSGMAVLRAAEAPPLWMDDFATLRPGWGVPSEIKDVSDHKLLLRLRPNLIHDVLYSEAQAQNLDLRIKIAELEGNTDQPGGIIFWATDHDNFYVARLAAEGRFGIGRLTRGRWFNPVPFQIRDEVLKGLGQVNELRVVTSGRSITAYVNGKQMATLHGFPPAGTSQIGVYGESGADRATWAFSELSVRNGPAASTGLGPEDDAILLADGFSTFDPAWGIPDEVDRLADGKLLVSLQPDLNHHNLYQGGLFDDIDLRMTVTQMAGGDEQLGGVVFWAANHDNYYAALFYSDGVFLVGRRVNGKWLRPAAMGVRDEVLKGLGQPNQLRIVTSGKSAAISVNNRPVVTFKGFPPENGSMIGVHAVSASVPYQWAFSDLHVRKGPASPETGLRDDSLLFADDFSTLDPGWGEVDDVQQASGNKLIMRPQVDTAYSSLYTGNVFGDADIRVKVMQTGGRTYMPAGLLFWADDYRHYYAALLRSDGRFFVAQHQADAEVPWKHLVPFQVWDAVRTGLGQVNEIRIVTRGNEGEAYVNDKLIGTFEGNPPEGGGKIGLRAQSGEDSYTWEFSDLVVRKPQ